MTNEKRHQDLSLRSPVTGPVPLKGAMRVMQLPLLPQRRLRRSKWCVDVGLESLGNPYVSLVFFFVSIVLFVLSDVHHVY